MHGKKYLICVVGPTAIGKTKIAIELAQWLQTEIVSADSRQFYQELEIGTAKPDEDELSSAKHHFINNLSIHDSYDVGLFEKQALSTITEIYNSNDSAILVGGSGLFVNAVIQGLDEFPDIKEGVREELNDLLKSDGFEVLQNELRLKDIDYYTQVDISNPQRIIRALEVIRSTGKPYSSFRTGTQKKRPFESIIIGLEMDREKLYDRIDLRMDLMIDAGLFEEAESMLPYQDHNALQTVGYKEIFGYLNGEYDKGKAIELLKRNSRRYAKRQLTWFKKNKDTVWFQPDELDSIKSFIKSRLEFSESEN